jgi:hypothetical protein
MPRTRTSAVASLLLLLAACASGPSRQTGLEPDPAVRGAVAATARAIAGRDVPVVVHVGHAVRAELRPDRSLHVWRGLLLRTYTEGELAFALAHELAHAALGHPFPDRGAERDVEQELAADARARESLAAAGFDPAAGADLLRALRDEAVAMAADAIAVAEIDRRIAAFASPSGASVRADDAWRAVWLERRSAWLAADPASADPQRLAAVERRGGAR